MPNPTPNPVLPNPNAATFDTGATAPASDAGGKCPKSSVGRAAEQWRRMSKMTMNVCSAGVLACGFTVLSSTVLWAAWGLESPPNPQTRMSALRPQRMREKARASSTHSKRWREFVHRCDIRREAFGVRPGLPALSDATTTNSTTDD